MGKYVIGITDGELTAGQQMLKIENRGSQPHFLLGIPGPEDLTEDQIAVVLEEEAAAKMTGTPPAFSDLNSGEDLSFKEGLYLGTQSTGASIWISVDLEPGTYGLVCFFPDLGDGLPHANKGMYTVVEVAE